MLTVIPQLYQHIAEFSPKSITVLAKKKKKALRKILSPSFLLE